MSEGVEMEDEGEKIETIVESGCRRTTVKPDVCERTKVKNTENVGKNIEATHGAHTSGQVEAIIAGNDSGGHKLKVVAQVADVTKHLA